VPFNFTGNFAFAFCLLLVWVSPSNAAPAKQSFDSWFESFKQSASATQIYNFLYAMPKGGDLHNHLSGSGYPDWWYQLATDSQGNGGYIYYTRTLLNTCQSVAQADTLLYKNIQHSTYAQLDSCQQKQYQRLDGIDSQQKNSWLSAITLDKADEGRDEFFYFHWQRLNELTSNPYIMAKMLIKNMQAFSAEGVLYLETILNAHHYKKVDGQAYAATLVAQVFRDTLSSKEAKATGVTVRLQTAILRFMPDAQQQLETLYRFVVDNADLYVTVNMVGIEAHPEGRPLRFLQTLRGLRKTLPQVPLSIHAGEMDTATSHVRDTLLLGATRIGHGLNLIHDPATMAMMRHSNILVETNLISNKLLEYVDNYSQHPFPEYLRTGIPVALSTDDRGMWDSNLTDEFFVAVTEFNLSWQELTLLGQNSLKYAFVDDTIKNNLLAQYQQNIQVFIQQSQHQPHRFVDKPVIQTGRFICAHYKVCYPLTKAAHKLSE
jgi:adenosine deaminase CECR1